MNVLFDSQAFDMQTHGGVSRCFAELYAHMPDSVKADIAVVETDNVYLQQLGFKARGAVYREFMGDSHSKWRRLQYKWHYNKQYGHLSHWDVMPDLNRYEQE